LGKRKPKKKESEAVLSKVENVDGKFQVDKMWDTKWFLAQQTNLPKLEQVTKNVKAAEGKVSTE